jgi:hypothetical protein
MKTLSFSGKTVKDVGGLYYDLLEQHFEVENVGAGPGCTYVYLDDAEEKDPTPFVDAWAEKPAFPTTKSASEERRKFALRVVTEAQTERAAKAAARAAQKAREEALGVESLFELPAPEALSAPPPAVPVKEGLFSKFFKVFKVVKP